MKIGRSTPLILLLVAALSVSALFVISCGSKQEAGGGGTTTGDTTGVTDTEIKIGSLLPLSGAASPWGIPFAQGMKAYFDYINDQGGIWGRKINLIVGDSQYSGPIATEAAKQMIDQQQVFAFDGNLGTEVEAAVRDMIDADNIPDFNILSGSTQFVEPFQKNRFTAMVPYTEEANIIAGYLEKTYAGKKVGILAQNDEYGKEGGAATAQALKDSGAVTDVSTEWYEASATDVTSQMQRLKGDNVDVVVLWGGPTQAASMMKTVRETLSWDVPLMVDEAASSGDLAVLAGPKNMDGVVGVAITENTDLNTNDVPGIVSRREIFQKYAPSGSTWNAMAFAGYYTAEGFAAIVKQNGPNLTRESFIATAENVCKWKTDISLVPESTSPTDHKFIEAEVLTKASIDPNDPTKVNFTPFGDPVSYESTTDCKVPKAPAGAKNQPGPDIGQ